MSTTQPSFPGMFLTSSPGVRRTPLPAVRQQRPPINDRAVFWLCLLLSGGAIKSGGER